MSKLISITFTSLDGYVEDETRRLSSLSKYFSIRSSLVEESRTPTSMFANDCRPRTDLFERT
jgi:hypothetical protein